MPRKSKKSESVQPAVQTSRAVGKRQRKKQSVETSHKRTKTSTTGRRVSRTTTHSKTKVLPDGSTCTVEDKSTDYTEQQLKDEVSVKVTEEFSQELTSQMDAIISKPPLEILRDNDYLKWRLENVLKSCRKFKQRVLLSQQMANPETYEEMSEKDKVKLYQDALRSVKSRPGGVPSDGFLVECSWTKCLAFAQSHYEECMEDGEDIEDEEAFISEYMSNRLVDKLLVAVNFNKLSETVWPTCTSSLGEMEMIAWNGNGDLVKVLHNMVFVFPVDGEFAMQGYFFKPNARFFPFDVLRFLDTGRAMLEAEMKGLKRGRLEATQHEIGFQRELTRRLAEVHV